MFPVTKEDYAKSKWRQKAYKWLTKKQKKQKSKAEERLIKAL